jgi:hypothetical protein
MLTIKTTRRIMKNLFVVVVFFLNSGCSYYVYEQTQEYKNPLNEIHSQAAYIEGYQLPDSYRLDKAKGHMRYRFTGWLKQFGKQRTIDIYIPKNFDTGRPVIEEVDEKYHEAGNRKAFLYFNMSKTRGTAINDSFSLSYPALIMRHGYPEDGSKLSLSFLSHGCDQNLDEYCQYQWRVTPGFKWVARDKSDYWFTKSLYLVSVTFDVAFFGYLILFTQY